jgi:hypothetical protein
MSGAPESLEDRDTNIGALVAAQCLGQSISLGVGWSTSWAPTFCIVASKMKLDGA